eukprot:gnl/MRDRNA2_/MRDRNA2_77635_c0_seq2.p1 gnl/MRDRNA2_/MRDRNA2_77635_c0~~gnl/MRDRNA2_/MRDRNA2_77635_c0_seq2.p1  ORF type:complete len:170 (-),score=20.38 gnl/MRDRNA2_/MRDRNA2_77635_c0_seq2:25-534(-)
MDLNVLRHGADPEKSRLLIVLLHGMAGDSTELSGFAKKVIADLLDSEPDLGASTTILLPEAPGRVWPSRDESVSALNIKEALMATIREALGKHPSQPLIVLGGFSQGTRPSAFSLPYLVEHGFCVGGFVPMSGYLDTEALVSLANLAPAFLFGPLAPVGCTCVCHAWLP